MKHKDFQNSVNHGDIFRVIKGIETHITHQHYEEGDFLTFEKFTWCGMGCRGCKGHIKWKERPKADCFCYDGEIPIESLLPDNLFTFI